MTEPQKVELGTIEASRQGKIGTGSDMIFTGDIELRAKAFKAVGAVKGKQFHRYTLPGTTSASTIESLSGIILADPTPGITFERVTKNPYGAVNHLEYTATLPSGETVTIYPHSDFFHLSSERLTLSRLPYRLSVNYRLVNGVWTHESNRFDKLTDAAKRDSKRVFGGLVAAFFAAFPDVLTEVRSRELARKREDLQAEIVALEKQLTEKRDSLVLLDLEIGSLQHANEASTPVLKNL